MTDLTQQEQDRFNEINAEVDEQLMPAIFEMDDALEDEYGGAVIFAVFIECMHALFWLGWTPESLKEEVDTHHAVHLEDEADESGAVH